MKESLYDRLCSYLIAQKNDLEYLKGKKVQYVETEDFIEAFEKSTQILSLEKHIEGIEKVLNQ